MRTGTCLELRASAGHDHPPFRGIVVRSGGGRFTVAYERRGGRYDYHDYQESAFAVISRRDIIGVTKT